jgi:arylsulfatase A-like enzyme
MAVIYMKRQILTSWQQKASNLPMRIQPARYVRPPRAAAMTGKYPARLHLTDWIQGHKRPHARLKVPEWQMYLDTSEVTIAEALKKGGYVTANFGKWHLGDEPQILA